MMDKAILKTKIEEYKKKAFPEWLKETLPKNKNYREVPEREKQKWVAAKHFQDK